MSLTDVFIKNVKHTGAGKGDKHTDDRGLYLLVTKTGKCWRMDYRFAGKRKTLALGIYPDVSLAMARGRLSAARTELAEGNDPTAEKKARKLAAIASERNTFEALADDWLIQQAKNIQKDTLQRLKNQLNTHVFPTLGKRSIATIKPPDVLVILQKIDARGQGYTATRMRAVMAQIFRFGAQTGRTEFNPAADMQGVVVAPRVRHRPALTTAYEFGQFLVKLNANTRAARLTKLCAQLGVFTWTRPGELRQAKWSEFDLTAMEWQIPAERLKTNKDAQQGHIVPLSIGAIEVLKKLHLISGQSSLLFPGKGKALCISENTVNQMFKKMGFKGRQSHHGLRASARSMLSMRGWSKDALERQLDHKEADSTVAAYSRAEFLPERREFMADWSAVVTALQSGAKSVPPIEKQWKNSEF